MKHQISLALTASLFAATGCYSYAIVPPRTTAAGQTVRVDLSALGRSRLASLVGPYAARVEGIVQAADDSTVTLGVNEVVRENGVPEKWSGERVRIADGDMNAAELRTFSATRTTAASVLALGVATIAAVASRGGNGSIVTGPATPPAGQ